MVKCEFVCTNTRTKRTNTSYAIICTILFFLYTERTILNYSHLFYVIVFRGLFISNLQVTAILCVCDSLSLSLPTRYDRNETCFFRRLLLLLLLFPCLCLCVLILPFTLFSCFKTLSTIVVDLLMLLLFYISKKTHQFLLQCVINVFH